MKDQGPSHEATYLGLQLNKLDVLSVDFDDPLHGFTTAAWSAADPPDDLQQVFLGALVEDKEDKVCFLLNRR
ncbi:MAG: hypothetical protein WBM08_07130 [Prochlorococcaceae cyanobacterium]